jgi:thiol-disulfide isomerase/thioredoxin
MSTPRRGLVLGLAVALAGLAAPAGAALPAAYQAMVVQPRISGQPATYEFDLAPALQRARQEGRWLYVYLGASDCPYCRKYEAFLAEHATELLPHFRPKYLLVDLRSELSVQAPQLVLRTDKLRLPYADFHRASGDQRARLLVYPSVWLLDANAKPLMQMPAGTGTFQTVPEQLEILRLEE